MYCALRGNGDLISSAPSDAWSPGSLLQPPDRPPPTFHEINPPLPLRMGTSQHEHVLYMTLEPRSNCDNADTIASPRSSELLCVHNVDT